MMGAAVARRSDATWLAAGGLCFAAAFAGYVTWLTNTASYREWAAPVVALVLILFSVPILARQARTEGDELFLRLFMVALLAKLVAAVVRHYLTFEVYGAADAVVYNRTGTVLAERFRDGSFVTVDVLKSLSDTEFIKLLTGIVYTFIGPTTWGGFLFFSWLAFWGSFLMYRAFTIAVPGGARLTYFRLLFFLPSMLYWPASIGKESWMLFSVGIAAFGCAKVVTGGFLVGIPLIAAGTWGSGVVRPHIAGFIGIAVASAVLMARPEERLRELGPAVKLLLVGVVAAVAVVLAQQAASFLEQSGIETEQGVTAALSEVSERTTVGDSTFEPVPLTSPIGLPMAVVTVLFRPLPFEAHNAQALLTSLESVLVGLLALTRLRWIWAAVKSIRTRPYVAFALTFVLVSIVGLSSLANFGILARQRTLLLPFFLVLVALPPSVIHERLRSEGDS